MGETKGAGSRAAGRRPVGARRVTRPRIRRHWLILSGIAVAIAALAATSAMLRVYPPPKELTVTRSLDNPLDLEVMILDTAANRSFFASIGADHDRQVRSWVEALERLGATVRVDSTLEALGEGLLILPHLYCLDARQLERIEKRLDAGAGILIAGPIGVRDAEGGWIGWERMHRLLGSTAIREFPMQETDFLVVGAAGPIGSLSQAGYRIRMQFREQQWGIQGLSSAAYWADYTRTPSFEAEEAFAAAGIARRGAGRLAWVGYNPGLVAEDATNRNAAARLLRELLSWCLSEPESEVDLWPGGFDAALTLVEDTETQFGNAVLLDELLASRGIRGGFMCVSDLGLDFPNLIRSISQRHDVGSHSDDHRRLGGQPFEEQSKRLRRSGTALSALTGRPARGLRPPEEAYDEATFRAMAANGFDYLLGDVDLPGALPEIIRIPVDGKGEVAIVLIPRVQPDDFDLVVRKQLDGPEILELLQRDLALTRLYRGIDFLSIHSHILGRPDRIGIIKRFLDEAPLEGLWITGPDRLAEWWRAREAVQTELAETADGRFTLSVVNRAAEAIEQVGVWVLLPGAPGAIETDAERWSLTGPDRRGAYRVAIDRLGAGERIEIPLRVVGEMAMLPAVSTP